LIEFAAAAVELAFPGEDVELKCAIMYVFELHLIVEINQHENECEKVEIGLICASDFDAFMKITVILKFEI
jgi:hypothetical protein